MNNVRLWWRNLSMATQTGIIAVIVTFLVAVIQVTMLGPGISLAPIPTPSSTSVLNRPPEIKDGLYAPKTILEPGEKVAIAVAGVYDPDGDILVYTWEALRGQIPMGPQAEPVAYYIAPDTPGLDTITVAVNDVRGGVVTAKIDIKVVLPTSTPAPTSTPTAIATAKPAATPTGTLSATATPTNTATPTATATPTPALVFDGCNKACRDAGFDFGECRPIAGCSEGWHLRQGDVYCLASTPWCCCWPYPLYLYPAPLLLEPPDGAVLSDLHSIRLTWSWAGTLGENEYFDVRMRREGEPHYGIAWTKSPSYTFVPPLSGKYYWAIAVIRGREGRWEADLSPESETWVFTWLEQLRPSPTKGPLPTPER